MTLRHLVTLMMALAVAATVPFCDRSQNNTLVQLMVVMRHPVRTPLRTFPTDRYQEDYWLIDGGGFGQLTRQGIRDAYFFGKGLHQCYNILQSRTPRISAYSIPDSVAISGANAVLAGISWQPSDKEVDILSALLQVIKPVHTLPENALPASCPSQPWCGDEASAIVTIGPEDRKNRQLLSEIAQKAGLSSSTYEDISSAMSDTVYVEKYSNLSLVDWIQNNDTISSLLQNMLDLNCQVMYQDSLPDRTLMVTSPLLNFIAPFLKNASLAVQSGKNETVHSPPQLLLVSGLDAQIAGLLAAFGDFNGLAPPFGSAVFIELTKGPSLADPLQVSVFYKNASSSELNPYRVRVRNGCGESCSLEKFLDAIKDAMKPVGQPSDFSLQGTVAMLRSVVPVDVKVGLVIFGGFCLLALITIVAALFSCTNRRRRKILYHLSDTPPHRSAMGTRIRSPAGSGRREVTSSHDDFFNDEDENALLMSQMPSGSSARQPLLMSS